MDVKVAFTMCFWHLASTQTHGWIYGWNVAMKSSFKCLILLLFTYNTQNVKIVLWCLRLWHVFHFTSACKSQDCSTTLLRTQSRWILLLLSEADILYKLYKYFTSILTVPRRVGGYVSVEAPVCVCVLGGSALHWFRSLNTMYSLTLTTII